ncbi:hypothetical protein [Modestobacter sp. SYSU DS0511]
MPEQGPEPSELLDHVPPEPMGELALAPVTDQLYALIERVRAAAGGSPDFGDVELGRDRDTLTVRWYGDLPPAVRAVVDDPGDAGVEVVVEQTRFRVGDLRAEADRLFTEHPGRLTAIGLRPAGDGIDVMVRSTVAERFGGAQKALERSGVRSDFPLFATAGEIVPA